MSRGWIEEGSEHKGTGRDSWHRVQDLFAAAVDLDPVAQRELLTRECGGDEAMYREVLSLLAADGDTPSFFEHSAAALLDDAGMGEALVGRRVGPYLLGEVLGSGGMGIVYEAVRTDDEAAGPVALKVLRRSLAQAEVLARFDNERALLATLDHPNIIALIDAGILADGRPYVVMEKVDGVRIDLWCDRQALDVEARLQLCRQICSAVQHAHQRLVVHRDLKPSNILVTRQGLPKLLDFGIAKLLDEAADGGLTATGRRAPMTLRYASPEQVRGEPVTTASDVYTLGVVFYELLTGIHPYRVEGTSQQALESAVLHQQPLPASEALALGGGGREALRRRLVGDLDTILATAMRKEPERRYGAVELLAEDLRLHVEGRPVRARSDTLAYRLSKLARRYRWQMAAAALLLVALAAMAVTSHLGEQRARASEAIAWRAHADAVYVTGYLAQLLERLGQSARSPTAASEALVLEMLADAEQRIATQLSRAPEAEARLRYAAGRGYAGLERWPEAEAHARRALELSRQTRGLGWTDVARHLELLARVLDALGSSEAAAVHRELAALYAERLGDSHPRSLAAARRLDASLATVALSGSS